MQKLLMKGKPVAGILICAVAALLVSWVAAPRPWRGLVPVLFVIVVTLLSMRFGFSVGVFGSITAAIIFAYFLFPPIGAVRLTESSRGSLAWMLLGGVTLSYLLRGPTEAHRK